MVHHPPGSWSVRVANAAIRAALVLAVSGCARQPVQFPVRPPPALVGDLEVSQTKRNAILGMEESIEAAFASRDVESVISRFEYRQEDVRGWARAVVARAEAPIEITIDPLYPSGDGVVANAHLYCARMESGGYARFNFGTILLRPTKQGRWMVTGVPSDDSWVMTHLSGDVWLQPEGEWLAADVQLTAEGSGDVIRLDLAARLPGETGWLRMREVTQDGEPVPFLVRSGEVVVQPRPTERPVELQLRYEGQSPSHDWGYVRGGDVLLRGADTSWLPTMAQTHALFDVAVHTPADFTVHGQGELVSSVVDGDTKTTTYRAGPLDDFTLYGAPAYVNASHPWGETTVTLALWPSLSERMSDVEATVMRAEKALAPLGPYPQPQLRVVSSGFNDGRSGFGAVSNIAVGWRNIVKEPDVAFFAHEISHGWFGGQVPLSHEARRRGQWNETFAEYVSVWPLEEAERKRTRQGWLGAVSKLSRDDERSMATTASTTADWKPHFAISYARGALLLTAIEDRIGLDRMHLFLRTLIKERTNRTTTWADILPHLEAIDADTAAWAREWIAARAMPELGFKKVTWTSSSVQGTITQAGATLAGKVRIVWLDEGGTRLGSTLVDFDGEISAFALEVPASAHRLLLDPDVQLPRRHLAETIVGVSKKLPE